MLSHTKVKDQTLSDGNLKNKMLFHTMVTDFMLPMPSLRTKDKGSTPPKKNKG
jgi:hypothetical protein